jgi:hypothetical protein
MSDNEPKDELDPERKRQSVGSDPEQGERTTPEEADHEKLDLSKHPAFYPMRPEDRLKPGEGIVTFIPRRRKPKKP